MPLPKAAGHLQRGRSTHLTAKDVRISLLKKKKINNEIPELKYHLGQGEAGYDEGQYC